MTRSLHWTLILGCLGLVALYARPAWDALSTGVPPSALAAIPTPPGTDLGELAIVGLAPDGIVAELGLEAQGASGLTVAGNH